MMVFIHVCNLAKTWLDKENCKQQQILVSQESEIRFHTQNLQNGSLLKLLTLNVDKVWGGREYEQ